jgi:hypothetical protein
MVEQNPSSHEDHKRTEGARLKAGTAHTIENEVNKIGHNIKFQAKPEYLLPRKELFDQLFEV